METATNPPDSRTASSLELKSERSLTEPRLPHQYPLTFAALNILALLCLEVLPIPVTLWFDSVRIAGCGESR